MSTSTKNQIGRWGEGLMYHFFSRHYPNAIIDWPNQHLPDDQDQKAPYDITLTYLQESVQVTYYCEIKTTRNETPTEAKLSNRQINGMFDKKENYWLVRVYRAGNPNAFFRIIENPALKIFGQDQSRPKGITQLKLTL